MEMELDRLSDEETLLLHFKRKKLSPFTTTNYTLRDSPKKTCRIDDTQFSDTTIPNRKKRSDRKKSRYESEYIQQQHLEEQEVAMCLIMLSRHNNMLDFDLSDNNSQDPDRNTTKVVSLKDLNTQFECTTCNKMFHSYQALGGHRASHNKNNNLLQSPQLADEAATTQPKKRNKKISVDNKSDNHHECPICFKVFQSGQALGGHKRSHLLASQGKNNPSQGSVVVNPVPEISRSFLDLNLPAPTEEDEDEGEESSSTTVGTFKLHQQWWVGPNLKHGSVIAN